MHKAVLLLLTHSFTYCMWLKDEVSGFECRVPIQSVKLKFPDGNFYDLTRGEVC
jgi:hypothetical protein